MKQECLSVTSRPHVNACIYLHLYVTFVPVTLTLILWPWYTNQTKILHRCTWTPKWSF